MAQYGGEEDLPVDGLNHDVLEAAEWTASAGPESAAPISVYQVRVISLSADEARLELRALRSK